MSILPIEDYRDMGIRPDGTRMTELEYFKYLASKDSEYHILPVIEPAHHPAVGKEGLWYGGIEPAHHPAVGKEGLWYGGIEPAHHPAEGKEEPWYGGIEPAHHPAEGKEELWYGGIEIEPAHHPAEGKEEPWYGDPGHNVLTEIPETIATHPAEGGGILEYYRTGAIKLAVEDEVETPPVKKSNFIALALGAIGLYLLT